MAEPVSNAERLRETGIDLKGFGKTHKWNPPVLGSEFWVFASGKLIPPGSSWILAEHGAISPRCLRLPGYLRLFKVIGVI